MSDCCPICGCKTEAFDFTDCELSAGKVFSACSFCAKQVGVLRNAPTDTAGDVKYQSALRWLDSAIEKDVPGRSDELAKELDALYPEGAQPKAPAAEQAAAQVKAPSNAPGNTRQRSSSDAQRIEELEKRLAHLEKSFKNYKRNKLIISALEVIIPLLLVGILIIIFLNSDLWDSFITMVSPSVDGFGGLIKYK